MVHIFRTYILIYEQTKIYHFWQGDWLMFAYTRENIAVLTNQSFLMIYDKIKLNYILEAY